MNEKHTAGPCLVQHVSNEDWDRAVIEQRKRVAFDADPRTKAARKAYKQARVRGVPEREAWAECSAQLAMVRSSLDQRERDGEFNP